MKRSIRRFWSKASLVVIAGGLLLQQGCSIDPDLILQAAVQFASEMAIFFTDNAVRGFA